MADSPQQQIPDGGIMAALSQIQQELGRQSTQLAVITTKLDGAISSTGDHETRIRALEAQAQQVTGGRDTGARWVGAAVMVATWAGVAVALLEMHH